MNKNSRLIRRLFVFIIAIIAAIVMIGIIRFTAPPILQEILLDSDAGFWPFTVQNVMWVALFLGFGELFLRWSAASDEESQLKRGYLPTNGQILTPDILVRIKDGITQRRFGRAAFLPRMISRTIDQYTVSGKEDQAVPINAESEDFLYQVTSRLGVAFTTTLLALVMSAVLVLLQSLVQAKEERALNEAGQYCLDNLILRLGGNH